MGAVRRLGALGVALCLTACVSARSSGSDEAIRLYHEQMRLAGQPGANTASGDPGATAPLPSSLTADEAVALAKSRSAKLAALAAKADRATALVGLAGRPENPELQVQNMRLDQFLSGNPRERTSIRVPIPRIGEIDARVSAAQADEADARAAFRAEEIAIEADVRWMFDDVLLLDAQIESADAVVAARDAVAAQMKARLDNSQATALDEAMAAVTAAEAVEDRVALAAQRSAARAALFVTLGIPADAEVKIVGDAPENWPPPKLPETRTLVEAALKKRPEIESAAARLDASGARTFAEKARRLPWFTFVELGYEVGPNIPAGQGITFQGGVELPIFNTNGYGVEAAESAEKAAKLGFAAAVQSVARDVEAKAQSVRVAEAQVDDLKKRVLPASQRAGAAIKQAVASNNIDVISALMVDVRRVRVELMFLEAVRRYRAAVSDLRRSMGGAIPWK